MKKLLAFGPLFVILAALLWSLDGVLRISLYSLPPTVVVFYEHLLGAIVLLFLLPKWLGDVRHMTRREWIAIGIVSLFSGALGTIAYTAALSQVQYAQYSVVVLLQQLQPIWAIFASGLLLRERITKSFLFWAGIAILSSYFITFRDLSVNLTTGSGTATAGMLALLAGLFWGSSTAISKFVLTKVSFLTATSLRFFLTPIITFVFILGQGQTGKLTLLTSAQWLTLIGITLTTGLVALGLYYYGLKKTPARVTTLCELVWPASAVLIDFFYFHKTLSLTQVTGIAVMLFALTRITKFR